MRRAMGFRCVVLRMHSQLGDGVIKLIEVIEHES